MASWHPDRDDRVANLVEHETDAWYTVGMDDMPAAGGYNLIPIPEDVVDEGELTVAVRPDIGDGMATATQFRARVVSIVDGEPTRHIVDYTEPHTIIEVEPEAELWLVVAKLSLLADFPTGYKVAFFPQPDFPEAPESDTAAPREDTDADGPDDSGDPSEPEALDTGTASTEEEAATPPTSTPPAYEDAAADGEAKSGCACTHNRHTTAPWMWILIPLIALRRSARPEKTTP